MCDTVTLTVGVVRVPLERLVGITPMEGTSAEETDPPTWAETSVAWLTGCDEVTGFFFLTGWRDDLPPLPLLFPLP